MTANGLIKKHAIIVDMGYTSVKVMEVTLSKGHIKVSKAFTLNRANRYYTGRELSDIEGLVELINQKCVEAGMKSKEVRIVLPERCVQYKIVETTAMKDKELEGYVKEQAGSLMSSASQSINEIDWCVFGTRETDNKKICLVAAVPKKVSHGLAGEFAKK